MFMGPVPTDAGRLLAAQEKECLAWGVSELPLETLSDKSNTWIYTL